MNTASHVVLIYLMIAHSDRLIILTYHFCRARARIQFTAVRIQIKKTESVAQ